MGKKVIKSNQRQLANRTKTISHQVYITTPPEISETENCAESKKATMQVVVSEKETEKDKSSEISPSIKTSSISPENVIKRAPNGHALVILNRTRVKGFCVSCIKQKSDPNFKKTMTKITTFCPKCPGGIWICEQCFDDSHFVS